MIRKKERQTKYHINHIWLKKQTKKNSQKESTLILHHRVLPAITDRHKSHGLAVWTTFPLCFIQQEFSVNRLLTLQYGVRCLGHMEGAPKAEMWRNINNRVRFFTCQAHKMQVSWIVYIWFCWFPRHGKKACGMRYRNWTERVEANTHTWVGNSRAHSMASYFGFEPGLRFQFLRDVGGSPHTVEGEERREKG